MCKSQIQYYPNITFQHVILCLLNTCLQLLDCITNYVLFKVNECYLLNL